MKRLVSFIWIGLMLCGCSRENQELDRAAQLRATLLQSAGCSFRSEITADYSQQIYSFGIEAVSDREGTVEFQLLSPETIAGIGGTLSHNGGMLRFQDTALHIDLLADNQLTPVAAPWIFLKTLRGGYLKSVCMEGEFLRLTIHDGYEEGALQADIWIDEADRPVQADFLYEGKRILSLRITDFQIL